MKPFLVFGLRGTLLERIHVRSVPSGMPASGLTVGLNKVWLRPHMLETLAALQEHCHIAVWSSTTARNTHPLVEATLLSTVRVGGGGADIAVSTTASDGAAASSGRPSGRFSKRTAAATSTASDGAAHSPLKLEFVWSREHTEADQYRRMNASCRDDAHATVKDLSRVYARFPAIATPQNTVLIDDTPSKAKEHAANFLWLDSCEGFGVTDSSGMMILRTFVEEELLKTRDVRDILPHRIRSTPVL